MITLLRTHLPTKSVTERVLSSEELLTIWGQHAFRFLPSQRYPGDRFWALWLADFWTNDLWTYRVL